MQLRSLLILLIILAALVPAWMFNRFLQKLIQPRRNFGLLLVYLLVILVFVAWYTFLLVWMITKIFPQPLPQA
jgi:ABC-type multidrug transport system permease subunit